MADAYAEGNTIRNALSAVRKKLGIRLRDSREVSRTGRTDHHWDVLLSNGMVIMVKIEHGRKARVWH